MTIETDEQESNPAYSAVLEFEADRDLAEMLARVAKSRGITIEQLVREAVNWRIGTPLPRP